jgi:hypothetical protein
VTVRTKSVSIAGTTTDRPFLMRTGKVQQNASDKGEGEWKIPNSGFTSQFKYKTAGGRFKGQLAGFTLCQTTTSSGIWTGGSRAKAQQPHITLVEFVEENMVNVIFNGAPGSSSPPTHWTAGLGTTLDTVSSTLGEGDYAIRAVRTSTKGTASFSQSSVVTADTSYRLTFRALGTDTTAGPIEVYAGGVLVAAVASDNTANGRKDVTFKASASGDLLFSSTNVDPGESLLVAYVSMVSIGPEKVHEIWLCSEGTGDFWPDVESLSADALTAILSASSLDYTLQDDDLVCTSSGVTVFAFGPVPFLCGWGYIHHLQPTIIAEEAGDPSLNMPGVLWAKYPGAQKQFSLPRASRGGGNVEPTWTLESSEGVYNFSSIEMVGIRTADSDRVTKWVNSQYDLYDVTTVKNQSRHAYYWQALTHVSDTSSAEAIYNSPDNPYLYYAFDGGTTLAIGDMVSIGPGSCKVIAEGATEYPGIRYIQVNGKSYSQQDYSYADKVYMMPSSLQWMTGWFDYYSNNPSELPADTQMASVDPFPLIDNTRSETDNPVKIFEQLMGKPAGTNEDAGIPLSYTCTTICDLFGYGDHDREIVDWDALKELVSSSGNMTGVTYSMEVQQDSTEGAQENKDLDILQMIQGVCITHGIRMVWEYNETQRTWVLTFKRDLADTLAYAVNAGRVINEASSVQSKPFEIAGGTFNYCGVKAEYKKADNGKEQFSIKDPSGMVQHRIGGKVLEVKDDLTVLPVSPRDAANELIRRFGLLTNRLALLSHKVKLDAVLSMAGKIPVADNVAIDLEYLRNPKSGRQNDGEQSGQVESLTIDLGRQAKVSMEVILSKANLQGISPSLYLDTWTVSGTTLTATVSTDPDDNSFADPAGGLTDAQTFFCYSYDPDRGGAYLRHTSCPAYDCYLIKRGTEELYSSGASQNVYTCYATTLVTTTLTLVLSGSTTNLPANNTGTDYVLIFAKRTSDNLAPCQIAYYGFLGDGNGVCHNSDDAEVSAIVTGG